MTNLSKNYSPLKTSLKNDRTLLASDAVLYAQRPSGRQTHRLLQRAKCDLRKSHKTLCRKIQRRCPICTKQHRHRTR